MSGVPIRAPEFIWHNIQGEVVLLNPHEGKYFGLNHVGCSFWEKIDGKRSIEDIINLLLGEYDVQRDVLESDIETLISEMKRCGTLRFD